METGYFASPAHYMQTKVHLVDGNNRPICGVRIGSDKKFQWCAATPWLERVTCHRCLRKYESLALNTRHGREGGGMADVTHKEWIKKFKNCRFKVSPRTEEELLYNGNNRGNLLCGNSMLMHRCMFSKCPLVDDVTPATAGKGEG